MESAQKEIKHLVLDVDGVLTTGQFLYTSEGKFSKIFGPHDNDGIKLISKFVTVSAISADKRGFHISQKRVGEDMGLDLQLVSEGDRLAWLKEHFDLSHTVYMGDGIFDAEIFGHVAYGIAPASAFYLARDKAHYVTHTKAGEGAVAEACLHIIKTFFNSFNNMR